MCDELAYLFDAPLGNDGSLAFFIERDVRQSHGDVVLYLNCQRRYAWVLVPYQGHESTDDVSFKSLRGPLFPLHQHLHQDYGFEQDFCSFLFDELID